MPTESVTIYRNGDRYVTSYDVWVKALSAPQDVGDGEFVGNYPIAPSEASIDVTWTSPVAMTWVFSALSIYNRTPGLFSPLTDN